ncbi:MAG TPA: DinB family protein [Longimicrobiaceae bacterium]
MPASFIPALHSQFDAAIQMLDNAIDACPDHLWSDQERRPEFWYLVFHTLFFLDYYLADPAVAFEPPAPFTRGELDPSGVMPERIYSRAEMREYLEHGRQRCRRVLAEMTGESAHEPCGFPRKTMSRFELHIYNLRHVQHHAAQLNFILRQRTDSAPGWVSGAAHALLPEPPA